ncbi:hypothetical protein BDA96_03G127500 [Sorghum bicolor]|uniref:Uncharacterized protein n=1 Tax=Sorghum bicolor TaxID=4558 RepID=A0A921RBL8_SORBI|nr:hypothetical protein BDA96_03G127500 [Sorghum bicolor]
MSTPRDPRETQSNISTPRDPCGAQNDMSMPRDIYRAQNPCGAQNDMSMPRDICRAQSETMRTSLRWIYTLTLLSFPSCNSSPTQLPSSPTQLPRHSRI